MITIILLLITVLLIIPIFITNLITKDLQQINKADKELNQAIINYLNIQFNGQLPFKAKTKPFVEYFGQLKRSA